ncbi:acyl-CoA thioesterase [Cytobacillus sp. IB215665]|uniref:acyl-CoA thioesterase n=1 Tax=Cytobacillus sp. IB215665 TaxID=3097357 RepID=UPI0039B777AE
MMHECNIKVRFSETDALGHVNNTSYFTYLEEARVEYFKQFDPHCDIKDWKYVVVSIKCDFINQAFFDQQLRIFSRVSHVGTKSFKIEHLIVDAHTNQHIAKGEAVIVYFNFETQQSEAIPDQLRLELEKELVV